MRARNLKPSLFKNELLAVADPLYTVIFEGLWCLSDREGRLEDRPAKIHFDINPGRAFDTTERALQWLSDNGFIQRYQYVGMRVIWVVSFGKHQDPHWKEAPSKLPPPEASLGLHSQSSSDDGASTALTPSSLTPDSGLLTPDSPNPGPARGGPGGAAEGAKAPDRNRNGSSAPIVIDITPGDARAVIAAANPQADPDTVLPKYIAYLERERFSPIDVRAHLAAFARGEHFDEAQWARRKAADSAIPAGPAGDAISRIAAEKRVSQ